MSNENEQTSSLDYNNVIEYFTNEKASKKPLKSILIFIDTFICVLFCMTIILIYSFIN